MASNPHGTPADEGRHARKRVFAVALLWIGVTTLAILGGVGVPVWILLLAVVIVGAVVAQRLIARADAHDAKSKAWLARVTGVASRLELPAMPAGLSPTQALEQFEQAVFSRMVELRSNLRDIEQMLHGADEAIIATGVGGRIIMCNAAAEHLVGKTNDAMRGRPFDQIFTQQEFHALHAAGRQGERNREQIRMTTPSGTCIIEASVSPLGDTNTGGVLMTLRDVTETAQAVQIKADFVANASHELRTPIAAIRMAVETLAGQARDDPAMRERLIGMIADHTVRLEELIRDLLDLSRLESPEFRVTRTTFPMTEIVEPLASTFADVCRERNLNLVFSIADEVSMLRTDAGLLTLILKNLIDNATKFAFEGTTIRVVGSMAGAMARFDVIDKGVGIPLAQQTRIFERFYQVDSSRTVSNHRRGTGLGLAIVKHAVRTLGGQIRVASVWKQGTTMTVDLPALTSQAAA